MKPKFEMGDRVIYTPSNYVGTICGVCQCSNIYIILLDDNGTKYSSLEEDIEFVNPKTAFLTRLQELLATFDAEICANIGEDDATNSDKPMMWIQIGDEVVNYERGLDVCDITAENVFDYGKD